jgi:hypothetical protein
MGHASGTCPCFLWRGVQLALATRAGTGSVPGAARIGPNVTAVYQRMADCVDKNMIDKDEYPQTAPVADPAECEFRNAAPR